MKIDPKRLDAVLAATDLISLVGCTQPHRMLPNKKDMLAKCPQCQENHLHVSAKRQTYHCFACGEGGSALRWVMTTQHTSFKQAVQILEDRLTAPSPAPKPAA